MGFRRQTTDYTIHNSELIVNTYIVKTIDSRLIPYVAYINSKGPILLTITICD